MNRCARGLLACAILAWSFWTPASASVVFESKLREADAIRTSDPVKFQRILTDLDGLADSATKRQREDLEFMHAYQMVRTGDMHGAIGKFKDLHANGASDEIRYRSGRSEEHTSELQSLMRISSAVFCLKKKKNKNTKNK